MLKTGLAEATAEAQAEGEVMQPAIKLPPGRALLAWLDQQLTPDRDDPRLDAPSISRAERRRREVKRQMQKESRRRNRH